MDYLHVKLWSLMKFPMATGGANVWKLSIFMLGCDIRVSVIVKKLDFACW